MTNTMNTINFKETNINPLGNIRNSGDCVINSLGIALNKSWDVAFNELVEIARTKKAMLNSNVVLWNYLKDFKNIDVKYINGDNEKKRLKVLDVCKLKGTYIISIANHLTCVKDGLILDKWNTQNKSAYKIWVIK